MLVAKSGKGELDGGRLKEDFRERRGVRHFGPDSKHHCCLPPPHLNLGPHNASHKE